MRAATALMRLDRLLPLVRQRSRAATSRSFAAVVTWTARPGEEEEVQRILQRLASATRAEPDCLQYVAHRSLDDPGRYLIYECYVDEHAFRAHVESEHFRRLALEDGFQRLAARTREFYSVVV
jgi:quinol monooxygenase YgiN